jgi:hypothetical protein
MTRPDDPLRELLDCRPRGRRRPEPWPPMWGALLCAALFLLGAALVAILVARRD